MKTTLIAIGLLVIWGFLLLVLVDVTNKHPSCEPPLVKLCVGSTFDDAYEMGPVNLSIDFLQYGTKNQGVITPLTCYCDEKVDNCECRFNMTIN